MMESDQEGYTHKMGINECCCKCMRKSTYMNIVIIYYNLPHTSMLKCLILNGCDVSCDEWADGSDAMFPADHQWLGNVKV